MEIARLSDEGKITVPASVINKLHLKTGDKIIISEENGRFYLENANLAAFAEVEKAFAGEAEKAGFANEAQMLEYVKEIRRELGER